jgi:hypothetical protein
MVRPALSPLPSSHVVNCHPFRRGLRDASAGVPQAKFLLAIRRTGASCNAPQNDSCEIVAA